MSEDKRSIFETRHLLRSLFIGALIAAAGVIAFSNSEREMPYAAISIAISTVAITVVPGYIVSAYLTNIHDANLFVAGLLNWVIYSAVLLRFLSRKSRKRWFHS